MNTKTQAPAGATLRTVGSSDSGHTIAQCDAADCRDINGRPWQQMYSRRTIEGARLAARDMNDHNRTRHSAEAQA
ncbi:hypothetical protein ABC337_15320 [Arthrobacter sp. 1P04PC]|uniref:hypothetical protein n=1 Tax=unclassified Arthrobacter TaxID=235627 RepID=UPI0039A3E405